MSKLPETAPTMTRSPENPTTIAVKVLPNASRTELAGWLDDRTLKIRVQSPAQDGKANKALIAFLAELVGVSKKQITIRSGASSRQKLVAFKNLSVSQMQRLPSR